MREGVSAVQNHPQPHGEFKTKLGYMKVKRGVKVVSVHGSTVLVLCSEPNIIDKIFHFVRFHAGFPIRVKEIFIL